VHRHHYRAVGANGSAHWLISPALHAATRFCQAAILASYSALPALSLASCAAICGFLLGGLVVGLLLAVARLSCVEGGPDLAVQLVGFGVGDDGRTRGDCRRRGGAEACDKGAGAGATTFTATGRATFNATGVTGSETGGIAVGAAAEAVTAMAIAGAGTGAGASSSLKRQT
jgi:hypothetical protein